MLLSSKDKVKSHVNKLELLKDSNVNSSNSNQSRSNDRAKVVGIILQK